MFYTPFVQSSVSVRLLACVELVRLSPAGAPPMVVAILAVVAELTPPLHRRWERKEGVFYLRKGERNAVVFDLAL